MVTATVLSEGAVSAVDYRCPAGPAEAPYAECHEVFSISYVRKGSFGYRAGGQTFEMVAGSVLVGHRGPLGAKLCYEDANMKGFGRTKVPGLYLAKGAANKGIHLAFAASSRAAVDGFHEAALKACGKDNGAPGIRADYAPTYYAAFVIDPDGTMSKPCGSELMSHHSASFEVVPDGPERCRLVWIADFLPHEAAEPVGGMMAEGAAIMQAALGRKGGG